MLDVVGTNIPKWLHRLDLLHLRDCFFKNLAPGLCARGCIRAHSACWNSTTAKPRMHARGPYGSNSQQEIVFLLPDETRFWLDRGRSAVRSVTAPHLDVPRLCFGCSPAGQTADNFDQTSHFRQNLKTNRA